MPSPTLVAAWLTLDTLPTEYIPLFASSWIVDGHDGRALVELAGLHGDDPHDVRDLLPEALADCGVSVTTSDEAAAMTAFTALAHLQTDGLAGERWIVDKVTEVVARCDYSTMVTDLPLGSLFGLDDEWGAGWDAQTLTLLLACVRRVSTNFNLPVPAERPERESTGSAAMRADRRQIRATDVASAPSDRLRLSLLTQDGRLRRRAGGAPRFGHAALARRSLRAPHPNGQGRTSPSSHRPDRRGLLRHRMASRALSRRDAMACSHP